MTTPNKIINKILEKKIKKDDYSKNLTQKQKDALQGKGINILSGRTLAESGLVWDEKRKRWVRYLDD